MEFHDAAGGNLWPETWHWDLNSSLQTWRGVRLDGDGRVIGLELDFGDVEGASLAILT